MLTYLFNDHLPLQGASRGSTTVSLTGGTATQQRYKPCPQGVLREGEVRGGGNALPTDNTYTGQKTDEPLGLMFYNARWYDPLLGRFAQADTLIPQPGSPLAWDRFAYVINNPVNRKDPSGHISCIDVDENGGCIQENSSVTKLVSPTHPIYEPQNTQVPIPINLPTLPNYIGTPPPLKRVTPTITPYFSTFSGWGKSELFVAWGIDSEGFKEMGIQYSASFELKKSQRQWYLLIEEDYSKQLVEGGNASSQFELIFHKGKSTIIDLGTLGLEGRRSGKYPINFSGEYPIDAKIRIRATIDQVSMVQPSMLSNEPFFIYRFSSLSWK